MTKRKKLVLWLIGAPLLFAAVWMSLNVIFYQEPAERFRHDNNVKQLIADMQALEKSVAANPDQPKKALELAHCYVLVGKDDQAIRAFGLAWSIVQKSPKELVEFASVLADKHGENYEGRPLALIEQAMKLDPQRVDTLIAYGTALVSVHQLSKAQQMWQQAMQLMKPDDERYIDLQGLMKELQKAIEKQK